MTEIKCVDVERIGSVLEYPADHPVRRHTDDCPRCRSLVQSYQAFLEAAPASGAGVSAARPRLDAAIRHGADAAFPAESRAPFPMKSGGWWRAWMRPIPALATALVVVAAAVMLWPRDEPTSRLRVSGQSTNAWNLSASAAGTGGSVLLAWNAVTGADAYEVRVYGPELEELLRLSSIGTSLAVGRSEFPANIPPGADLTWVVTALRGGDVTQTSPPGSLHLP
jgi:hypothetical protein